MIKVKKQKIYLCYGWGKNGDITLMTQRVPRYTSYPTAPHFHDKINAGHYQSWLNELPSEMDLSLYFHVPFCRQLCWFCGCHTKIVNHYDPIARYMKLLQQEVELVSTQLQTKQVKHIHFGGGSPTIVSPQDFLDFMSKVKDQFSISPTAEIAIEMDPRTLQPEKIQAYKQAGVNRASIGVQDFDEAVQTAINRIQPFPMVRDIVAQLRRTSIEDLNIDLVYGLPFQTQSRLLHSIAQTLKLKPNRISLFGYAHVPWMKKHQNLIQEQALPCEQERLEMFEAATHLLSSRGYVAIGLDHFVRSDDALAKAEKEKTLQRNFQGYTTDTAQALLGLGVSAITTLPASYVQNTSNYIDYEKAIGSNQLPVARGIALNRDDIERRDIIMSLMCTMSAQINRAKYALEFNQLQPFFEQDDIEYYNGTLRIKPKGRPYMRLIAANFDSYLNKNQQQYSKAV